MIQPQWPGLGAPYQPPSWGSTAPGAGFGIPPTQPGDGISSGWWDQGSGGAAGSGSSGGSQSLWGMLQSLIGLLGQLVGGITNGSGSGSSAAGSCPQPGTTGCGGGGWGTGNGTGLGSGNAGWGSGGAGAGWGTQAGWSPYGNGGQMFANATLSSTGDPHLSETGTLAGPGGPQSVNAHFDSMTSHQDLIDAAVPGGYRVSTTATAPDANGVTYNQSATIHANGGRDAITMNRDGSYSVVSNGQNISLSSGQALTLGGGETVTANADGSLVVADSNRSGGSISTTLRANGNGVDVTANAQHIRLGGDIVEHGTGSTVGAQKHNPPVREGPLTATV